MGVGNLHGLQVQVTLGMGVSCLFWTQSKTHTHSR
jgi:hypothetical protein